MWLNLIAEDGIEREAERMRAELASCTIETLGSVL